MVVKKINQTTVKTKIYSLAGLAIIFMVILVMENWFNVYGFGKSLKSIEESNTRIDASNTLKEEVDNILKNVIHLKDVHF